MTSLRTLSSGLAVCWLAAAAATAAPNPFEWVAVSPIVVTAVGLGENGKWTEVRVERVLRGDVAPGQVLRVDLRRANRDRNYQTHARPLRLDEGAPYVLLLDGADRRKARPVQDYELVRGISGVRELPAEGSTAVLDALARFIEIQDRHDDRLTWRELGGMLRESNPIMLEAALDLFLKFRRGDPDLLPAVRTLLDHPSPELRERAARLLGQTLSAAGPDALPDLQAVREDLVARARRDGVVAVRIASTEALGNLPAEPALRELLEEIAEHDPDQAVRYAAERLLYDLRVRRAEGEGSGRTGLDGAGVSSPNPEN